MKAVSLPALATASWLTISSGCQKGGDASPASDLTSGRLVKVETTLDGTGQNPRPRWRIDVAPLSLAGYQGTLYQQVKTFSLPATADYQVGQTITFQYQLVPYAQQTPWKTGYEWNAVPAMPPGATALPEITLIDTYK
ncbi:hypothetical protein GCM10023172_01480 [Hymenobacter ginsengisoli]|uniref:Proteinase inhibitor I42 chagasin domain-containing protein n=1 Tax=Hymenobacter ginsengisoli TaxID=1051626 RepID=A0ABP8PW32_9BACT|nr:MULTISPECIES: hypothetical protein [unclassified Hymenobacter]MBO2033542.1 hypothetical protein [Hymenobacter sp. BT559]